MLADLHLEVRGHPLKINQVHPPRRRTHSRRHVASSLHISTVAMNVGSVGGWPSACVSMASHSGLYRTLAHTYAYQPSRYTNTACMFLSRVAPTRATPSLLGGQIWRALFSGTSPPWCHPWAFLM